MSSFAAQNNKVRKEYSLQLFEVHIRLSNSYSVRNLKMLHSEMIALKNLKMIALKDLKM
jgi:hypothetical protein